MRETLFVTGLVALSQCPKGLQQQDISLVGPDVLTFGGYDTLSFSGAASGGFILNDVVFNRTGVLFAFVTFLRTVTPVRLQIWRPLDDEYDFQLVFEVRLVPGAYELNRRLEIYLEGNACVQVLIRDRLGFLSEGTSVALGYTFLNTGGHVIMYNIEKNTAPTVGQNVTADQLTFPYLFELAAAIDEDMSYYEMFSPHNRSCRPGLLLPPDTSLLTVCNASYSVHYIERVPGQTGPQGPVGPPGYTGQVGPSGLNGSICSSGSTGPPGSVGAPGQKGDAGVAGAAPSLPSALQSSNVCACTGQGLFDNRIMIVIIVWLFILTLLVIAMLGVMVLGQENIQRYSAHPRQPPIREQLATAPGGWASGPSRQGERKFDSLENDKNWSLYSIDTMSINGQTNFRKKKENS